MLRSSCSLEMCESDRGRTLTVYLSGEIDHHSAVRVRGEIDAEIAAVRPKRTVLVLSEINFMDSSGLGLIMGRYQRMKEMGGELILRDPSEPIMRIFRLAGLEKIVRIEGGEKRDEA